MQSLSKTMSCFMCLQQIKLSASQLLEKPIRVLGPANSPPASGPLLLQLYAEPVKVKGPAASHAAGTLQLHLRAEPVHMPSGSPPAPGSLMVQVFAEPARPHGPVACPTPCGPFLQFHLFADTGAEIVAVRLRVLAEPVAFEILRLQLVVEPARTHGPSISSTAVGPLILELSANSTQLQGPADITANLHRACWTLRTD